MLVITVIDIEKVGFVLLDFTLNIFLVPDIVVDCVIAFFLG